jgi:carbonic anhydrase
MDATDELLAANRDLVASLPPARLEAPPRRAVAILTCMDARLDFAAALGIGPGEAHVLRNAGGVVTEDTIRSLAISQRKLGTREAMVVHHTRCGMEGLDEDSFRAELEQASGAAPGFAIGAFTDLDADVRDSVRRLRSSPLLPHRDRIRGFVYDVDTHALREVEVAD